MCRYLTIQIDKENGAKVDHFKVHTDYTKACAEAEAQVIKSGLPVEIFERASVAKPTTSVLWEGRRRPGAGA